MLSRLSGLAALATLAGCPTGNEPPKASADADPVAATVEAALDRSADPCQDFYAYACGGWLENTQIPSDQAVWYRSFSVIQESNIAVLQGVLESGEGDPRLAASYGACTDEATVDAKGVEPLQPMLDSIADVKDADSLMRWLSKAMLVDAFFGIGVEADFVEPDLNVLHVSQGGLGLPDRDYYFRDDADSVALRGDYEAHVARMFQLLGDDEATAKAAAASVMAIETRLAESSMSRTEMRDPTALHHRLERDGLQALTPSVPWGAFFDALGRSDITTINVMTPDFFTGMQALVSEGDWAAIRTYLRWRTVSGAADALSKPFVDEDFAFYGTRLKGQAEQRPRWKRCVDLVDGSLGELLGQAYVERAFAGSSKEIALDMIHRVEVAFEQGLPGLEWMDDETRGRALEKLHAISNKIGYPDRWRDYAGLEIAADDHFGNLVRTTAHQLAYDLDRVGKPVDPTRWLMSPPTVNAYYNPQENEIVFPAGIMQAPFFDVAFPQAMNYGAMGMVMGHEITHGFDDEGRQFSPTGALEEWWAPEVAARFEEQAQCVIDTYSGYEVQPDLFVNGELTTGENIADLGGIKLAHGAYKAWRAEGGEAKTLDGFTDDQLFFVAFAQSWCALSKPEIERMRVNTDPHSPPRFRVNGPLAGYEGFAEAFECPVGSPMNPESRCEVW